ncbi:MAG: copper-binding protein [Blastocatellia bacterium]
MNEQDPVIPENAIDLRRSRGSAHIRRFGARRNALVVSLVIGLLVCGACRKSAPARPTHEGVTGVVVAVDKDQGTIQINHEEIKGYMPAMSMNFRVRKKFLLDDIKQGDRVQFTLRDTPNGYMISQLKKQ